MNETNMNVVLEALAETIQRLRVDLQILKYENERLKAKNEELMMAMGDPTKRRSENG